ncbi:unnamed protein product [Ectocarpus sp. 12 AP-2014]
MVRKKARENYGMYSYIHLPWRGKTIQVLVHTPPVTLQSQKVGQRSKEGNRNCKERTLFPMRHARDSLQYCPGSSSNECRQAKSQERKPTVACLKGRHKTQIPPAERVLFVRRLLHKPNDTQHGPPVGGAPAE